MPLVAALDVVPGIRPVLGLFEGVCTEGQPTATDA